MAKQKKTKVMKVILCPGYVLGKNDNDRHYISAGQLIRLYGVLPTDIKILDDGSTDFSQNGGLTKEKMFTTGWIELAPRYDGNYYDIHRSFENKFISNKIKKESLKL